MSENNKVDQYINEYFNKNITTLETSDLFRMIEVAMGGIKVQAQKHQEVIEEDPEILSEEKFKAGEMRKFMSTALAAYQVPSEQAGKAGTEERLRFQKHISNHIGGITLEEKIKSINKFAKEGDPEAATIAQVLSVCGTLSILSRMIEDFNPSAAGFAFEAFLAALLKGKQIADPEGGGPLPIEDAILYMTNPKTGEGGTPVSLKLLNPSTVIEGSIANLLKFLGTNKYGHPEGDYPYIVYIVAIKHTESIMSLTSFTISPHNFFDWVDPKNFDFSKLTKLKRGVSLKEGDKEKEDELYNSIPALEKHVAEWRNLLVTQYFPYFGFTEPKESQAEAMDIYSFIPTPTKFAKDEKRRAIAIQTALDADSKFKKSKVWSGMQQELGEITDDEATEFSKTLTNKKYNPKSNLVWVRGKSSSTFQNNESGKLERISRNDFYNILLKKLSNRRTYFIQMANTYAAGTNFSAKPLNRLRVLQAGGKTRKAATGKQRGGELYLSKLVDEGKWKQWADLLTGMLTKAQFHIPNADVTNMTRADTEYYGEMQVSRKSVEKLINKHSEKLKELCAPVYAALGDLTDGINNFFLGKTTATKAKAALAAEESAKELSTQTGRMAKETKQEG